MSNQPEDLHEELRQLRLQRSALRDALQATGCERLREWFEIGPVQRAALETFVDALAQEQPNPPGCEHCNHPLYAATKCRVCGRVTEPKESAEPWEQFHPDMGKPSLNYPPKAEPAQEPVAKVELMKIGGNAGLATRIVEIDDHLRERLRPGQLLYAAPPQLKPLTIERLRDALVASRIIPPAAVEDPDEYDDGVTLFRIEALHRRLT